MNPLFEQLGFVSALLGGFAMTVVSVLLPMKSESRLFLWTLGGALGASLSLMIAAVAAVFAGLGVAGNFLDYQEAKNYLAIVSQAFLLGICLLMLTFGASGWLNSRRAGVLSTVIASIAIVTMTIVVVPFLRPY